MPPKTDLQNPPEAEQIAEPQTDTPPAGFCDVPAIGLRVKRDEEDVKVVFVFTREQSVGGILDPDAIVPAAFRAASRIFTIPKCKESLETMKTGMGELKTGDVTVRTYNKAVRAKILELLRDHGFKASTYKSLDNDEVSLHVKIDSDKVKTFAHNENYRVPFQHDAYKDMAPEGHYYPGKSVPRNYQNDPVPAYSEYDMDCDLTGKLQPFRDVDEIRLIMTHLQNYMNIPELMSQNIVARYFYPATFEQQMRLGNEWANMGKVLEFPDYGDDDLIRDFFGEQITFLFNWVAFFTRSLFWLGVGGFFIYCIRKIPAVTTALSLTAWDRHSLKLCFSAFVILWATAFNNTFKAHIARRVQRWGMDDPHTSETELPSYSPDKEGKVVTRFYQRLHTIAWVLFVIWFILGVSMINAYRFHQQDIGEADIAPLLMTAWMLVNKAVWSKAAPPLVQMQNHRTDARWYDSLTFSIASVNLFIALWPGIEANFVQKYTGIRCGDSKQEVLELTYAKTGLPPGTDMKNTSWVDAFLTETRDGQTCIYGCFPKECAFEGIDQVYYCRTNCLVDFQFSLITFFIVQMACFFIFAVIPVAIMRFLAGAEMKAQQQHTRLSVRDRQYTLTQVHNKREEIAPYEYKSWGGSYTEDFLEIAVAFTTLVCFGCLVEIMPIVGVLCFMVIYRVLAYRMTHITSRPYPTAAPGIGAWQDVFDYAGLLAVVINIGLVCFVFAPFRDWEPGRQFLLFIVLENVTLICKYALESCANLGADVELIGDVNNHFMCSLEETKSINIPKSEKRDNKKIFKSLGLIT